jgi:hypothetical protein
LIQNLKEIEKMDKKKYLVPEEEVLELKYQSVLCASDPMEEEEQPAQGGGGGGLMP